MTIAEKIQTTLIGSNWKGEIATNEILTKLVGHKSNMYDQDIDDGVDDDETEDTYVMKACFDFADCDIEVRIYYGDVTEEIGFVDVQGDDCDVEYGQMHKVPHFHIPNLNNLEKEVTDFVKANQGEKGQIDTNDECADTIWGFVYDEGEQRGVERQVTAVRVTDNTLEVLLEESSREWRAEWRSVSGSDIYRVPTLFSIAESIGQYV